VLRALLPSRSTSPPLAVCDKDRVSVMITEHHRFQIAGPVRPVRWRAQLSSWSAAQSSSVSPYRAAGLDCAAGLGNSPAQPSLLNFEARRGGARLLVPRRLVILSSWVGLGPGLGLCTCRPPNARGSTTKRRI
jgi:hypothetical protein